MSKPKCPHKLPQDYCDVCQHDKDVAALEAELAEARRERDAAFDKAIRFDLDQGGIEFRERDAVELVELRAKLAEAERTIAYKDQGLFEMVIQQNEAGAVRLRLEAERDEARRVAVRCAKVGAFINRHDKRFPEFPAVLGWWPEGSFMGEPEMETIDDRDDDCIYRALREAIGGE